MGFTSDALTGRPFDERKLPDRDGEAVPGHVSAVGEVEDTVLVGQSRESERRFGEVPGVRRASALIGDHPELVALGEELQHGAHEVVAEAAEEPGRADDDHVLSSRFLE